MRLVSWIGKIKEVHVSTKAEEIHVLHWSSYCVLSKYHHQSCTCVIYRSIDDEYDECGRSLEEDEPLSPSTAGNA